MRKSISVVFCDIVGSTSLGERLDPESLRRVMSRYYGEMRTVLERHGGSVGKFMGDAVMALFGVPTLHEDDPLRAVRAAAEMQQSLTALNEELEREWGVRLTCRIGVNTGEVLAGDAMAAQHLVVGDALNTAARLEQSADPGEILLSERTLRLVRHAVEVEDVPALSLKGKADDVRAYRLLAVSSEASARPSRHDSPIVGREAELERLHGEFESSVAARCCRLLTILGPAGVGKTRLVEGFVHSLGSRATILEGRCIAYGEGATFWAANEVVKQAAGILPTDTPEDTKRKIMAILQGEQDDLRICDGVSKVIGGSGGWAVPEEMLWSLRKFLEAVARRQPLVVYLEDLHWAEPMFLDLVEQVVARSRGVPLLLLGTARPELLVERRSWSTPGEANLIELQPLGEAASTALLDNLAGQGKVGPRARSRILRAAEGNPLFLEQMLLMFMDEGTVLREDEEIALADQTASSNLPATVQAVLAARLDRLRPEERRFLEAAAIEGASFGLESVARLLPEHSPAELVRQADGLVVKELIEPGLSAVSRQAFRFRHILIRDVAYESIPKQTRSDLHERFADWMEEAAADQPAEHSAMVGHHLELAYRYRAELRPVDDAARELAARASGKLAEGGRVALSRGNAPAAANLLRRAVALLPALDSLRPELLVSLGAALRAKGDLSGAGEVLEKVIDGSRARIDAKIYAHALLERGWLRLALDPAGWAAQALSAAEEALSILQPTGDDRGMARAYQLMTEVRFSQGQLSACRQNTEMALEHARRSGDLQAEADARMYLGGPIVYGEGTVEEMLRLAAENLKFAEQNSAAWVLRATASHAFGRAYAMIGEFQRARDVAEREKAMLEDLGQVGYLAWTCSHVSAFTETLAGNLADAEAELRWSYSLLEGFGAKNAAGAAARLAQVLCTQGRYEEAERFVEVVKDAMPSDIQEQALWRSALAKILAHRGELAEAEKLAREATALLETTGFINQTGDAELDLATVLLAAGRPNEAAGVLEKGLELYRRKGNRVSAAKTESLISELPVAHPKT